jgi:hypothetical protein
MAELGKFCGKWSREVSEWVEEDPIGQDACDQRSQV